MIQSQWNSLLFWLGAGLVIVLATVFYRPAAAKTGSLLVWLNNRVYIMDIDTLALERVGPAEPDDMVQPSPGCFGAAQAPCRVLAGPRLYTVIFSPARPSGQPLTLPTGQGYDWLNDGAVSWSPNGDWLAYPVWDITQQQAELRLFHPATGEARTEDTAIDPAVAPAWSLPCASGLETAGCRLAFKKEWIDTGGDEMYPGLIAITFAGNERQSWEIPTKPVFDLAWTEDGKLLYSAAKRHFRYADDHTLAYTIPRAGQLANMSPHGDYTIYYQPFRIKGDCTAADANRACLHVGVWVNGGKIGPESRLIYDVPLADQTGGLNFIPVWDPRSRGFVFFQDGNLVYYDLQRQEAAIWYKPLAGKLRSVPVFSPNEEAVAFVDNQGRGHSDYRLLVINPRLQPVEHIVQTKTGFKVLAWLPD